MLRGLYTSGSGMLAQSYRLDVISNNLANATTPGFKRDNTLELSFPQMLLYCMGGSQKDPVQKVGVLGTGSYVERSYADFSPGAFQFTDNPLDLAIDGEGFFALENGEERLYTRDGSFHVSGEGWLVDPMGRRLLGENGPINVGADCTSVIVDETGQVYSDGQPAGRITVYLPEDVQALEKVGGNCWINRESPVSPVEVSIKSGYIEGSNVNVVQEMVQLIALQRAYDASQRVIVAYDDTLGKLLEVGKF